MAVHLEHLGAGLLALAIVGLLLEVKVVTPVLAEELGGGDIGPDLHLRGQKWFDECLMNPTEE